MQHCAHCEENKPTIAISSKTHMCADCLHDESYNQCPCCGKWFDAKPLLKTAYYQNSNIKFEDLLCADCNAKQENLYDDEVYNNLESYEEQVKNDYISAIRG